MTGAREVRVAVLTPPGRGAIATIAVSGPEAATLLASKLRLRGTRRLEEIEVGQIVVANWLASGEEVVVARVGSDRFEINCHGGTAAVESIVNVLVRADCRLLDWRQWLFESSGDPIAAEALQLLAIARTTRTAAILWDQAQGALTRWRDGVLCILEAGHVDEAAAEIEALLLRASVGLHLVRPWRVVLAGFPNVGKSSLLNALLGYERVIVFDQPGTTRDVVTALTAINGWPIELTDTAGLGQEADELDVAASQQARRIQAEANLVVLVLDVTAPDNPHDDELRVNWPDTLVVYNKCDLSSAQTTIPQGSLKTSAVSGLGIDKLMTTICERLVASVPKPGEAVSFTDHQASTLREALEALRRGEPGAARHLLAAIGCHSAPPGCEGRSTA